MSNVDEKLECLRLVIKLSKTHPQYTSDVCITAQRLYNWLHKPDKPTKISFEKVSKERE